MDLVWRGPRSDLGNPGHYDEVHAKTSRGPFFIPKKTDVFVFQQGGGGERTAARCTVQYVYGRRITSCGTGSKRFRARDLGVKST
jgi:hypothetical protein